MICGPGASNNRAARLDGALHGRQHRQSGGKRRSGESEALAFADSTEARTFPGWRWLTPSLVWAQWTAVDSRINFKRTAHDHPGPRRMPFPRPPQRRAPRHHALCRKQPARHPALMPATELLAVNDLGLRKPLDVLPYVKTMGDFILTCEDTSAANRYMDYLSDTRDSAHEAAYQHAIRYVRSQPSEGQIWWVTRQAQSPSPLGRTDLPRPGRSGLLDCGDFGPLKGHVPPPQGSGGEWQPCYRNLERSCGRFRHIQERAL